MDETCDLLRQAWGTTNARPCRSAPRAAPAWRRRSSTPCHEGDVVVVGVNGLFGQRMCDVAARCGAEVVARRARVGPAGRRPAHARRPPEPSAVRRRARRDLDRRQVRHRRARRCQGRRAPRHRLPSRASPASSCTPTTGASTSATPAPRSASASRPAWRRSRSTTARSSAAWRSRAAGTSTSASSAATSARRQARAGRRTYHHTAPVAMVVSLHAGLRADHGGRPRGGLGPPPRGRQALQDGLQEMGLELFAADGYRLPELTTVKVPTASTPPPSANGCSSGTASRSAPASASTPRPSGGSA